MANAWRRDRPSLLLLHSSKTSPLSPSPLSSPPPPSTLRPFDCRAAPQASPVFASLVEGVRRPFLYSLADLPDKPHKNIARMLKGKPFRRPDISVTVQEILERVVMATFAAAEMGFRVVAFEPVFENLQWFCDGVFSNRAEGRGGLRWPPRPIESGTSLVM